MCSESMSPRSMKWTLSEQKANARVQDPLHPPCPHVLTTESGGQTMPSMMGSASHSDSGRTTTLRMKCDIMATEGDTEWGYIKFGAASRL